MVVGFLSEAPWESTPKRSKTIAAQRLSSTWRCSQWEPAGPVRGQSGAWGGWLPWLTFTLSHCRMPLIKALMGTAGILALMVLLFFTCWLLAAGCSRAHIFVTNQSGSTVSNLTIAGSCKQRHLDILPAGSEWKTVTPYRTPGHFEVSFVSARGSHTASPDTGTNLSGFCGISFNIGSNMTVTSEVRQ